MFKVEITYMDDSKRYYECDDWNQGPNRVTLVIEGSSYNPQLLKGHLNAKRIILPLFQVKDITITLGEI